MSEELDHSKNITAMFGAQQDVIDAQASEIVKLTGDVSDLKSELGACSGRELNLRIEIRRNNRLAEEKLNAVVAESQAVQRLADGLKGDLKNMEKALTEQKKETSLHGQRLISFVSDLIIAEAEAALHLTAAQVAACIVVNPRTVSHQVIYETYGFDMLKSVDHLRRILTEFSITTTGAAFDMNLEPLSHNIAEQVRTKFIHSPRSLHSQVSRLQTILAAIHRISSSTSRTHVADTISEFSWIECFNPAEMDSVDIENDERWPQIYIESVATIAVYLVSRL